MKRFVYISMLLVTVLSHRPVNAGLDLQPAKDDFPLHSVAKPVSECGEPAGSTPIFTVQDLQRINENLGGHYFLCNDLDLRNRTWRPIGFDAGPPFFGFTGIFDGNHKTIQNLRIGQLPSASNGRNLYGLFSEILFAGVVHDLTLKNVTITTSLNPLDPNDPNSILPIAGALAGGNWGYVQNVKVEGTGQITNRYATGGLVGILSAWGDFVGTIEDCHVGSGIEIKGRQGLGGLVGDVRGGFIYRSSSSAAINGALPPVAGDFNGFAGGLVGVLAAQYVMNPDDSAEAHILESWSDGPVEGDKYVGGLVGQMYSNTFIDASLSRSKVRGRGILGGLVGSVFVHDREINSSFEDSYVLVTNSYSTGDVIVHDRTGLYANAGGLIGNITDPNDHPSTAVRKCYSLSPVSGDILPQDYGGTMSGGEFGSVGAVVGNVEYYFAYFPRNEIVRAYFNVDVNPVPPFRTDHRGQQKTAAQLKSIYTYNFFAVPAWSISETGSADQTIWKITHGVDYPKLAWELEN